MAEVFSHRDKGDRCHAEDRTPVELRVVVDKRYLEGRQAEPVGASNRRKVNDAEEAGNQVATDNPHQDWDQAHEALEVHVKGNRQDHGDHGNGEEFQVVLASGRIDGCVLSSGAGQRQTNNDYHWADDDWWQDLVNPARTDQGNNQGDDQVDAANGNRPLSNARVTRRLHQRHHWHDKGETRAHVSRNLVSGDEQVDEGADT